MIKKKTTKNFIFYFPEHEASSITSISSILEDNYKRITGDLNPNGIPKIKIKVYPSVDEFHKGINAPNAPPWEVGTVWMADEIRMVSPNNSGKMHTPKSIIQVSVHEFSHCVVFSINPQLKFTCPWLSENIALYEAGQFRNPHTIPDMKKGNYPSLAELNLNMQNKKVYAVGYTIIEYIKSKWGMDSVRELIKANGNLKVVLDKKLSIVRRYLNGGILMEYIIKSSNLSKKYGRKYAVQNLNMHITLSHYLSFPESRVF